MAYRKKPLVILFWTSLVLLAGAGVYGLWTQMALRDRPWQLEFRAENLVSACRTGPGAHAFRPELANLDSRLHDARKCVADVDDSWTLRRDYAPCVQKLLNTSLLALRIRLNETIRADSQKQRLSAALQTLAAEIEADSREQPGTVRNYSQFQARTLLESARNLASLGQTESALVAVLNARAAWAQSESFIASELARFYDTGLRDEWERLAQRLLSWTAKNRRSAILVDKLEHRCFLLTNGRIEKTYDVNLGRNWFRNKAQEHDASTPEGEYRIVQRFSSTAFGYALLLNYPNTADSQRFNSLKRSGQMAPDARIGSGIEIHGGGRPNSDWTDGCVSLDSREMADLYRRSYVGMPVTIVGTSSLK